MCDVTSTKFLISINNQLYEIFKITNFVVKLKRFLKRISFITILSQFSFYLTNNLENGMMSDSKT